MHRSNVEEIQGGRGCCPSPEPVRSCGAFNVLGKLERGCYVSRIKWILRA